MKRATFAHKLFGYIERELEATLAVLIILGFAAGSTFAQTATPTLPEGTFQVAQTGDAVSSNFVIRGVDYGCLNFSSVAITDCYRVRTFTSATPDDIYTSEAGINGATPGTAYTLVISLSQPVTSTVYLDGTNFTNTSVNGTKVTSSSQAIKLNAASKVTLSFMGGDGALRMISQTPGTGTPVAKTVSSTPPITKFFVFPSDGKVIVGGSLTLKTLAFDADGRSISVTPTWSITSGSDKATVNSATGEITAKAAGLVSIKATVDGFSASATISVLPAETTAPVVTNLTPTTSTQTAPKGTLTTPAPLAGANYPWYDDVDSAKIPDAVKQELNGGGTYQPAVINISDMFSTDAVVKRAEASGVTQPTSAEIKAVVNSQTSFGAKIAARATIAVNEMISTIKEIAMGVKITDDKGLVVVERPSAVKQIGNFILGLISGGHKDAGASPLRSGLGGAGNN